MARESPYVALSYCWGKKTQSCQTTASTLSDHKTNIRWATLPRTLQDAIQFTRMLGIEYLWVDCLCIVQGDREDWERESGRMSNVYRCAYVTLAAAWGDDSNSGLFSVAEDFEPNVVANLCLNDQIWPLYLRPAHPPICNWDACKDAGETPLFDRGWTFQERLISPKVIYFTRDELAFQCSFHAACECGLTQHQLCDLDPDITDIPNPKSDLADAISSCDNDLASPAVQLDDITLQDQECIKTPSSPYSDYDTSPILEVNQRAWLDLVRDYSKLKLTNPTDKLPAFGAVARQFQALHPRERYLAGLWSGSLHLDLLWYTHTAPGPRLENIPTWSWASISGLITYLPCILQFTRSFEIADATCSYVDDNPFGVFKSSSLVLYGRLTPCGIRKNPSQVLFKNFDIHHPRSGLRMRENVRIDIRTNEVSRNRLRRVYLLELCNSIRENSTERCFLVLERKSKENQTFCRVGVAFFLPEIHPEERKYVAAMDIMVSDKFSTTEFITLV